MWPPPPLPLSLPLSWPFALSDGLGVTDGDGGIGSTDAGVVAAGGAVVVVEVVVTAGAALTGGATATTVSTDAFSVRVCLPLPLLFGLPSFFAWPGAEAADVGTAATGSASVGRVRPVASTGTTAADLRSAATTVSRRV